MPIVSPLEPSSLPSHESPSGDIQKITLADLNRAFHAVLELPENKKLIEDHTEKLAEQTLASRAAFENIGRLLLLFDSKAYKNKDGQVILALHPTWDILRKEYDELLKKSRDDAIILKAVCDDYVERVAGVLDEEGTSVEDVKAELKDFLRRTEESEKRAQFFAEDFHKLRSGVELHKKVIEDSLESADADPNARIPELQLSIIEIKAKITEQQRFIDNCLKAAETGEKLAAMGMLFMGWCPPLAALVVGGLLAMGICRLVAYKGELGIDTLRSKLQKHEEELTQLKAQEETLKELRRELVVSAGAFQTIIAQLCALSDFWKSVKADCQGAIEHLGKVETAQSITQYGLKMTLSDRFAGPVYISLSQTLAVYASRVAKLG